MISPLRMISLFILFSFLALVQAREASLYSSSASACSSPSAVTIEQFDVQLFKANSSLAFNITGLTALSDLNLTAKVTLNAYAMQPVDLSFDPCQAGSTFCPLPGSNFSGAATVTIPTIKEDIPRIVWVTPDLESIATFQLVRTDTNETVACIQNTLSNGLSTHQTPVSWLVGSFVLFTFLLSVLFTFTDAFVRRTLPAIPYPLLPSSLTAFAPHPRTFITSSPLLYRFLTILFFLQHIVLTALLDLDYPLLYRSFALNFSWAFGLFETSPQDTLQRSIYSLRARTGGNTTDAVGAAESVAYINRELSPYNAGLVKRSEFPTSTVVQTQGDGLSGGITLYSNALGIADGNAFLSLFYVLLFGLIAGTALVGVGYVLVRLVKWVWLPHQTKDKNNWTVEKRYMDGVKAIFGRVLLAISAPTFVLVFFQWTIADSWLAVLLSVITIVAVCSALIYTSYTLIKVYKHQAWSKSAELLPYPLTAFTEQWATHRWFTTIAFVLPVLVLKAAFVAFAKTSKGWAQVVAFIVLDAFSVGVIAVLRPSRVKNLRGWDLLEGFIAAVRLVTSSCLVAFVPTVHVKPGSRASVGVVLMTLESLVLVVLFVGVLRDTVALVVAGVRRRMVGSGVGVVEDYFDSEHEQREDVERNEKRIRAVTMATTDLGTNAYEEQQREYPPPLPSYPVGGGYTASGSGEKTSRSGTTTPETSIYCKSIIPLVPAEIIEYSSPSNYSTTNNHISKVPDDDHSQQYYPREYSTITKPETVYPKSYAPSSMTGGLGLSMAGGESKLSFDAFAAPIHAKYSTAGVGRAIVSSSSSDFAHSDSTHGAGSSSGYHPQDRLHQAHHRSHYPSIVLEEHGDSKTDLGSISPSTMVSDIRMGFVRGEHL